MNTARAADFLRRLRRIFERDTGAGLTDVNLLQRFVVAQDESAFALLVERHGPQVLGVCRRVLRHEQDAEDAFQATFLVLARKAAAIRRGSSLASWLYGVAYRTAMNAKKTAARWRSRGQTSVVRQPEQPPAEAALYELQALLDDELHRLPEKYRAAFVLCCLEGKSKGEAASELGCPEGTVASRLDQARRRLRQRLARRGIELSAVLCAADLSGSASAAVVPAKLAASVLEGAELAVAGESLGGAVSGQAAALADGTLRAMALTKLTLGAGLVLLGALVTVLAARQFMSEPQPRVTSLEEPSTPGEGTDGQDDMGPARFDRFGDPLPPRAISRLGTIRFRGVRGCLAFSPDGTLLAAATGRAGEQLTLWDLATNQAVRQINLKAELTHVSFSPDGRLLACNMKSPQCQVLETETGDEPYVVDGVRVAFMGDGKTLVTVGIDGTQRQAGGRMRIYNANTGVMLNQGFLKNASVISSTGFDDLPVAGRTLALLDSADISLVHVYEEIGAVERVVRTTPGFRPLLALAPDGSALASGRNAGLELWDVATGKRLNAWAGQVASRPVFSPDGKRLAWTGEGGAGIAKVWVVDCDGAKPQAVGAPVFNVEPPCFSPDGKALAVVTDAGAVEIRDVVSGKDVRPLDAHTSPVIGLAFTRDGRHVVSRTRTDLFAWEARTGQLVRRSNGFEGNEELAGMLPDGRLLTGDRTPDPTRGLFRVRDGLTGREELRFDGRPDAGPPCTYVAPAGRYAALRGRGGEICVVDLKAGKCIYRVTPGGAVGGLWLSADGDVLVWHEGAAGSRDVHVHRHAAGKKLVFRIAPEAPRLGWWLDLNPAVSPDGRWFVVPAQEGGLRRWDLTTGVEAAPLTEAQPTVLRLVWSPDGRWLATQGISSRGGMSDDKRDTRVCEVCTGRRLAHFKLSGAPENLLFSPDGRTLFTTGPEGAIDLWELATGGKRGRRNGHLPRPIGALALSPDGRMLASGGHDTQILVWDLTGLMPDGEWRRLQHPPDELRAFWETLALASAPAAYRALWQLAADPEGTTALLCEKLRPVPSPASDQAEKPLIDRPPVGEHLQALRAVEVLEWIGTPQAQEILRALAAGAPGARLTQEASASLQRLAGRP